ncbi:MAG: M50 family metallopeptidase [Patescibacteria group bacterium]
MILLIFIIVLSILILIHEFGHFIVAKRAGVKVEEFALGFPPKIFSKKIGETIYSVNVLPIGGFVRLFGEDDDPVGFSTAKAPGVRLKLQAQSFFHKPMGVKLGVALAGAGMNLLLGVVIFAILYSIVGIPTSTRGYVAVSGVVEGSPAQSAGFQQFDRVLKVEDVDIKTIEDLKAEVSKNEGKEISILVDRSPVTLLAHMTIVNEDLEDVTLRVTPQQVEGAERATVGIMLADMSVTKTSFYSFPEMVIKSSWAGVRDSFVFSKTILFSLGDMVRNLVVKREVPEDVSGPVGIAVMVGEVYKFGILPLLSMVGILTLNLAVVNLLPFPGLDGARALFIVLHKATGNKIAPAIEKNIHLVGIVILLTLVALITVRDIGRFFN